MFLKTEEQIFVPDTELQIIQEFLSNTLDVFNPLVSDSSSLSVRVK